MIVNTVNTPSQLRDEFQARGRYKQFSYNAYDALHDYYWELGESIGEPVELDVVGICCDWCEYDTIQEIAEMYSVTLEDVDMTSEDDEDEIEDALAEEMSNRGCLLRVEGGSYLWSE